MKMLPLKTGLITSLLLVSFSTLAGSVAPQTVFVKDTPAVAADVNKNFSDIKTAVDENDTRITANGTAATTNTTAIATNVGNIGTNTTAIGTNTTAITTLQQNTFTCAGNSNEDIMVRVGPLCVDKYEASVWDETTLQQVGVSLDDYEDTTTPVVTTACEDSGKGCSSINAQSKVNVLPSRYITWFQAQQACANSGKRLLTNAEWQMAVADTHDPGISLDARQSCNTVSGGSIAPTGESVNGGATTCVSRHGVFDMIGNASEMVADWMQGSGADLTVAKVGKFASSITGTRANATYDNSEIVGMNTTPNSTNSMPAMIIRGGSHESGVSAGAFAMRADHPVDFAGNESIGFRCAR